MTKLFSPYRWRWLHKGHEFGQITINEESKLMFVNIPKNASQWALNILRYNGWKSTNYNRPNIDITDFKAFTIVRDPYERYISGLAEYIHRYHNDKMMSDDVFEILFDLITVDDHTELQSYFLNDIDFDTTTFIMCDKNLSNNMNAQIFKKYNIKVTDELLKPFYMADEYSPKYKLQNHIKSKITPEIEEKIKKHFQPDYVLIDKIRNEKHMSKLTILAILKSEIKVLKSKIMPEDSGHIFTAISVLKDRIEEIEQELTPEERTWYVLNGN